jgi:hypothetical protein
MYQSPSLPFQKLSKTYILKVLPESFSQGVKDTKRKISNYFINILTVVASFTSQSKGEEMFQ